MGIGAILLLFFIVLVMFGSQARGRDRRGALGCFRLIGFGVGFGTLAILLLASLLFRSSTYRQEATLLPAGKVVLPWNQLEVALYEWSLGDHNVSADALAESLTGLIVEVCRETSNRGVHTERPPRTLVVTRDRDDASLETYARLSTRLVPGSTRTIELSLADRVSPFQEARFEQVVELIKARLSASPYDALPLVWKQTGDNRFTILLADVHVQEVAASLLLPDDIVPSAEEPAPADEPAPTDEPNAEKDPIVEEDVPSDMLAVAEPDAEAATPSDEQPAWVGQPDGRVGDENVYRMSGSAGPYSSRQECLDAEIDVMRELTHDYLTRYLGERAAERVSVPTSYIESHLFRDSWIGPVETQSFGTMWETHVLLEFDDAARRQFEAWWQEAEVQRRLSFLGLGAAVVLGLLATMFGYLKLDTATKGFYSSRLQLAASLLVAVVLVAGVVLGVRFTGI